MTFADPPRDLAANCAYFALQLAQAGFLSISLNDCRQGCPRKIKVAGGDAVLFHLLRQQMPPRDFQLLFFGVTGEPDYFHAIA